MEKTTTKSEFVIHIGSNIKDIHEDIINEVTSYFIIKLKDCLDKEPNDKIKGYKITVITKQIK